jgi:hypothetical protein
MPALLRPPLLSIRQFPPIEFQRVAMLAGRLAHGSQETDYCQRSLEPLRFRSGESDTSAHVILRSVDQEISKLIDSAISTVISFPRSPTREYRQRRVIKAVRADSF